MICGFAALRSVLKWLAKLLVSAGLLAWFFSTRDIEFSELARLLSGLDLVAFVIAVATWIAMLALGGWRWKVLLAALGMNVPVTRCVRLTMAGVFFSTISFGPLAADGLRTWWMSRIHPGRAAAIIITLVVDRVAGLFALGMICLGLFPTQWQTLMSLPSTAAILWLVLAVLGGTLGLVGLAFFFRGESATNTPAWIRKLPLEKQRSDLAAAIRAYWNKPRAILQALLISLLIQALAVLSGLFTLWSLRLDFPTLYGATIIPLVNVLQALPITIMGLGVREASVAELFRHITETHEPALAFAMLVLVINLLGGAVGLLAWLGMKSPGEKFPNVKS